MRLAQWIGETTLETGKLAVFYLAQAGFCFKRASGQTVVLDPYLSDCCERMFNFKRMIPTLMTPGEFSADILLSTHSHTDHLDPDLLETVKTQPGIALVGSPDCADVYRQAGIAVERCTTLAAGQRHTVKGVEFRAIYADHGELAPDAVGFLINIDGITVYAVGDTAFRPEKIMASLSDVKVDIMIVPINPAYGNPGEENAVKLAELVKPQVVIGAHFGMFIVHGGSPAAFLDAAQSRVNAIIMAPGERMIYSAGKIVSSETFKQD